MLPEFTMYTPHTLDEALDIIRSNSPNPIPISGGTNLIIDLQTGRKKPASVIDISQIDELRYIKIDGNNLVIGSNTTITEISKNPLIAKHAECLKQASEKFANPLTCNRATVGGNLADASPAADSATPLLALNASITLVSKKNGSRTISLNDFFVHVRKTKINSDELITSIQIPLPPDKSSNAFYKLGLRKADAISIVSSAVMLELDNNNQCEAARIALGSVAPTPIRVIEAEKLLIGKTITEELISQAGKAAADHTSPITDVRASADYRSKMANVLVSRLIRQVIEKINQ